MNQYLDPGTFDPSTSVIYCNRNFTENVCVLLRNAAIMPKSNLLIFILSECCVEFKERQFDNLVH